MEPAPAAISLPAQGENNPTGPAGASVLVGRGTAPAMPVGEQRGEAGAPLHPLAPHDGDVLVRNGHWRACVGDTGTHTLCLQRLTFGSAGTGREAAGQGRLVGDAGLTGQLGQPDIPAEQRGKHLHLAGRYTLAAPP